jgi:hypothetical protein
MYADYSLNCLTKIPKYELRDYADAETLQVLRSVTRELSAINTITAPNFYKLGMLYNDVSYFDIAKRCRAEWPQGHYLSAHAQGQRELIKWGLSNEIYAPTALTRALIADNDVQLIDVGASTGMLTFTPKIKQQICRDTRWEVADVLIREGLLEVDDLVGAAWVGNVGVVERAYAHGIELPYFPEIAATSGSIRLMELHLGFGGELTRQIWALALGHDNLELVMWVRERVPEYQTLIATFRAWRFAKDIYARKSSKWLSREVMKFEDAGQVDSLEYSSATLDWLAAWGKLVVYGDWDSLSSEDEFDVTSQWQPVESEFTYAECLAEGQLPDKPDLILPNLPWCDDELWHSVSDDELN